MSDEFIPDDAATAIHRAIIKTLRESAAVAAAFEGKTVAVFEIAPARVAGQESASGYPVIEVPTLQEIEEEIVDVDDAGEDDEGELIVMTDDPREIIADVHVYSRADPDGGGGGPEVRRIMSACRKAIGRTLALAPEALFRVVLCERQGARHFTESDETAHSVGTFRYLVEPKGN